jgi:hypothetical protein
VTEGYKLSARSTGWFTVLSKQQLQLNVSCLMFLLQCSTSSRSLTTPSCLPTYETNTASAASDLSNFVRSFSYSPNHHSEFMHAMSSLHRNTISLGVESRVQHMHMQARPIGPSRAFSSLVHALDLLRLPIRSSDLRCFTRSLEPSNPTRN